MLRLGSLSAAFAAFVIATGALAAGEGHHHDGQSGAYGIGTLNVVDTANGKVNVSHGPLPALKWPKMTMDLPVTDGVDLEGFEKGDKVQFAVKMNEKKVYQITVMCETDKDKVIEGLCGDEHHDGVHHDGGHHGDDGHHDHE